MPNKFDPPTDPVNALYHWALCGNVQRLQDCIQQNPHLVKGQAVIDGAWSHGGRRCGAQDDVIECLWLLREAGADFASVGVGTLDSAFKTFPQGARILVHEGASVEGVDDDGLSVLHRMIQIGYRTAAEFLLDCGAAINRVTSDGQTGLDMAITLNLPTLSCMLRDRGGTQNATAGSPMPANPPSRRFVDMPNAAVGEVMWYRADRGYGYLRDQSPWSRELFFDMDHLVGPKASSIEQGTELAFEVTHDKFGLKAGAIQCGVVSDP